MQSLKSKKIFQQGFGLIEITISIAILGVAIFSMFQLAAFSLKYMERIEVKTKAYYLGQEAIEAVRFLRDTGWTTNIKNIPLNTNFYPEILQGKWVLSASDPGVIDNLYTRYVFFNAVYRDANDNIAAVGNLDQNTKKITVKVTWQDEAQNQEAVIATYLTNFSNN